jgi:hypothetical protein
MHFCSVGNHVIVEGDLCKEHPPQRDPPAAGRCQWGSGHFSPAIWALPKDGKYYCTDHLARIVRVATWGTK